MGHVGSFVNAYLSPWLAARYYEWRLGRWDFAPNRYVWWQTNPEEREAAPLPAGERWGLLAAFAAVAAFGGRRLRFVWVAAAVGLFAFPTVYFGFLRYAPWVALVKALGVAATADWAARRLPRAGRAVAWGALAAAVGVIGVRAALYTAIQIDQAEQMREVLRRSPPRVLRTYMYGGDRSREAAARHGYPSIDRRPLGIARRSCCSTCAC